MADKTNRLTINAPGRFYVDDSCVDCNMCREIAPATFALDEDLRLSYVVQQPESVEEISLAEEAVTSCPTESIGNDG